MLSKKKSSKNVYDNTMINVLQRKLFQWTCERHATNQPLNREILGDKVIDLSTELGLGDFECSKSWLTTFLRKHGFSSSLNTSYGPIFNDYREWIELMRSYMTQYRYKNLFQVDEMGMYHDISPENIPQLTADYVTCRNGENKVNRVTVLLCCNASGDDKLPPVVCGNLENRLDNAVNHNCQYHTNQNAWLTSDIFKLWLSQLNSKMCKLNRKILLMLNRTRVHTLRDAVLSNVSLMFFPNDFPPDLQPLKSNIFHHVKMIYRRNYTKKILNPNFEWNMADTITNIVQAWDSVPEQLIVTSFRRTNFRTDNNHMEISFPEWESLNPRITFQKYVTFDDNLCVSFSPIRRSKRLAEIGRVNYREVDTPQVVGSRNGGCYELVELADPELNEDVVEDVSRCSEISRFSCNLPIVNSYDCGAADGLTSRNNRDVEDSQNSKPKDGESDSKLLQCSKDYHSSDSVDVELYCACPLTDTVISYVSDMVKNAIGRAVDNIPDFMKPADGSQRSTGPITNRPAVDEDDEAAPIRSKRQLEKIDEDVPNDDSREPTEKKQRTREEGWSDIYEHRFVFGNPENTPEICSAHADIQPTINSSERSGDLEEKSIFTIKCTSSNETRNE